MPLSDPETSETVADSHNKGRSHAIYPRTGCHRRVNDNPLVTIVHSSVLDPQLYCIGAPIAELLDSG